MSYNSSLLGPSPREDPKGGGFLEESSGGGDGSSVLRGDSLVTGLGAVLLLREGDGPHKRICVPSRAPAAFRLYLRALFSTHCAAGRGLGPPGPGLPLLGLAPGAAGARGCWCPAAPARRLLPGVSAVLVAHWACFLPFWAWQLARLYQGEPGLSPAAQACLSFGVTCLAYGNSCASSFLYTSRYRGRRRAGTGSVTAQGVSLNLRSHQENIKVVWNPALSDAC